MKKISVYEILDTETDKTAAGPKKEPATRGTIVAGGGCTCWLVGADCWLKSASDRYYLHRNSNGVYGDCVSGWAYFYHLSGPSGWHYCP